ncbi:MAG: lysylphosphatidylglycerol synthase transmembrane domain-containing protein [Chloroflexota bacterium]
MRRNWKIILGVLVSVLSLIVSIRSFDLQQIADAVRMADFIWVIPAVLLYLGALGARTLRMMVLFLPEKRVPFIELLSSMAMGRGANNIYPFRVGEVVRWALFHRLNKVSGPMSFASIVIERVFDGITMLLFLVIVVFAGGLPPDMYEVAWAALALFGVALSLIYAQVLWPTKMKQLMRWFAHNLVPSQYQDRVENVLGEIIQSFATIGSVRSLTMVLLTSFLVWSFETAMYRVMMTAFGFGVSFHRLMLMAAVANLATSLPSAPGNIGTFDGAVILALRSVIGVNLSIAYISLLHAVLWLTETLAGLFFMWRTGMNRRQLADMVNGERIKGFAP